MKRARIWLYAHLAAWSLATGNMQRHRYWMARLEDIAW